jgi:hypothetical protein
MMTKTDILLATHYGLGIYAHVLRQYYPNETVLHLVGRDCGLCRNPFANDEPTLHIWLVPPRPVDNGGATEEARHEDLSSTIHDGDAFTFAEQHYHLSGEALLTKLEEELHLCRKNDSTKCEAFNEVNNDNTEKEKTEIPVFSFFRAPISNTFPHQSITLLDAYHYIIGHFARQRTHKLRSITDAQQARRFKANNFDYCCFSGVFSKRNDNALIRHSSLMCIDFDHLPDPGDLFRRLLLDDYFDTQLLFRSPSGDGLKWIIPIDLAEYTHGDYFHAVAAYILHRYNVQIDKSGRDISRACFLPHDPDAYLNPKILHQ